MKHEGWDLPGIGLDEIQAGQLTAYQELLERRAVSLGMIAESDVQRLRERHISDSLRAAAVVLTGDRDAYDLGSGAGLPGIPVAIAHRGLRVTLVETRRNRVAFLELAVERLGLSNVVVRAGRIEDLADPVDLCLARAFSDAAGSWAAAEPLLRPNGRLVYFAGGRFDLAQDVPEGVTADIAGETSLASPGMLVIMARQ